MGVGGDVVVALRNQFAIPLTSSMISTTRTRVDRSRRGAVRRGGTPKERALGGVAGEHPPPQLVEVAGRFPCLGHVEVEHRDEIAVVVAQQVVEVEIAVADDRVRDIVEPRRQRTERRRSAADMRAGSTPAPSARSTTLRHRFSRYSDHRVNPSFGADARREPGERDLMEAADRVAELREEARKPRRIVDEAARSSAGDVGEDPQDAIVERRTRPVERQELGNRNARAASEIERDSGALPLRGAGVGSPTLTITRPSAGRCRPVLVAPPDSTRLDATRTEPTVGSSVLDGASPDELARPSSVITVIIVSPCGAAVIGHCDGVTDRRTTASVTIRAERADDRGAIFAVVEAAFDSADRGSPRRPDPRLDELHPRALVGRRDRRPHRRARDGEPRRAARRRTRSTASAASRHSRWRPIPPAGQSVPRWCERSPRGRRRARRTADRPRRQTRPTTGGSGSNRRVARHSHHAPEWASPEAAQVLRLRNYDPAIRGLVVYPPAFDVDLRALSWLPIRRSRTSR